MNLFKSVSNPSSKSFRRGEHDRLDSEVNLKHTKPTLILYLGQFVYGFNSFTDRFMLFTFSLQVRASLRLLDTTVVLGFIFHIPTCHHDITDNIAEEDLGSCQKLTEEEGPCPVILYPQP